MTATYRIDSSLNLIYYAGYGTCTSREFLEIERNAFRDPLRMHEMKIILDLRNTVIDVDLDDLRALVAINKQLLKEGRQLEKTAIISVNSYMTTLNELFKLMADDMPVKAGVFNQLKDAVLWLELSYAEEQINQLSNFILEELKNERY